MDQGADCSLPGLGVSLWRVFPPLCLEQAVRILYLYSGVEDGAGGSTSTN